MEFALCHGPQLKHVKKSEPRPCNPQIGKPEPKAALHPPNYKSVAAKKRRAKWLSFLVDTYLGYSPV